MTTQKILSLSLIVAACFAVPSSSFAGRRHDRVAVRQMSRQAKQAGCRLMTHREALCRAAAADVAERQLAESRQSEQQLNENLSVAQAEIAAMQAQLAALTKKNKVLAVMLNANRQKVREQSKQIGSLRGTVKSTNGKLAKEQAGRKAEKAKAAKLLAASQQQLKQAQTQLAKVTQNIAARDLTVTQLQQKVKALEEAAMKSETPEVEATKPAEADAPEGPALPEKSEESPQST